MTAGDIGVVLAGSSEGALTSVFKGWGPPLIVTRRFLDGGPSETGGGAFDISTEGLGWSILGCGGGGGGVASNISWSSSSLIRTMRGDGRLSSNRSLVRRD